MRVMVSLEDRFFKTQNGNVYSNTTCDYKFWSRYLQVFDEVVVFARVCNVPEEKRNGIPANGPGISFFSLPYYIGPWQYLKQYQKLVAIAKQAKNFADVFILRIPGTIGTLLWHHLMEEKIPYAVEVMGSSTDSMRTSGANLLVRGIHKFLKGQKEQCENASAALYVTHQWLQRQCPARCWSVACSDIDLSDDAIISEAEQKAKIKSIRDAAEGRRPFRICHAGTMEALYKAQDVLIRATATCIKNGLNIEMALLGDGRKRCYFESIARQLGVEKRVFFPGWLPPGQAVRNELDKADLFILPSLTEGQPRVLIEAMARGLPCIGSNAGGIPELFESEYIIAAGDVESLAVKIRELVQNPARLERMSRRNWEESKQYRLDVLNQKRIIFYKKVAELARSRTLRK